MLITNKVKIHMDTPHQRLIPVDVMQCDTETRALELELYVASKPWVIPTDVELVAAYFKTNGVKGLYDTLHDGSPACSTAGNVITAILPPEALSTPGQIMFSILMRAGERTQLSTFSVPVRIHPNLAIGAGVRGLL